MTDSETDSRPLIRTTDLTREYRLGSELVRALDHVSLDIQRGERLAVLGKSGSGKSTLMNLLGGLDRPTSGQIEVDGRDIAALSKAALARYRRETVGFVFQSFNLQHGSSALDNVALPLVFAGVDRRTRRQRAAVLLERVGLGHRVNHKPTELSGGEQQRVAVARALVSEPRVVLADEPTGNLDTATGNQMMELLHEINQGGTTMIIVTHDAELAATWPTRVIRMADGRVIGTADTAEVAAASAPTGGAS